MQNQGLQLGRIFSDIRPRHGQAATATSHQPEGSIMTKRVSYRSDARRLDGVSDYMAATAAVVAKRTRKASAKLVREVVGDREGERPGNGGRFADLPTRGSLVEERPPKRG